MDFLFKVGKITEYKNKKIVETVEQQEIERIEQEEVVALTDLKISGKISEEELRETDIESYMNKVTEFVKIVIKKEMF